MQKLSAVILAAGLGKRMKQPDLPKVLTTLDDKPLLGHVLDSVEQLNPENIIVVVGYKMEKVKDYTDTLSYNNIDFVVQEKQLGTGHAVMQAKESMKDFTGDTLILNGDTPLVSADTLRDFVKQHKSENSDLSVLTANAPDPTGYGRIVRDENNNFMKIKEQKDATDEELKITEFNSGTFLVNNEYLFQSLDNVDNKNAQGEYYLTDIVEILQMQKKTVKAFNLASYEEVQGVNSPEQLAEVEAYYNKING